MPLTFLVWAEACRNRSKLIRAKSTWHLDPNPQYRILLVQGYQALQAVQAHEMRGQGISQHTNNHTHTAVTPLQ